VDAGAGTGRPSTEPMIFGGIAPPADISYGSGIADVHAALRGLDMMAPHPQAAQMRAAQIRRVATAFGISIAAATTMVDQGIPAMAGGGRPAGPTLVGEHGPEIFTPDVPGTISPMASPGRLSDPAKAVKIKPANWDAWLNALNARELPGGGYKNIEDRRNEVPLDPYAGRFFDMPIDQSGPLWRR
jgi:hypothetical protein